MSFWGYLGLSQWLDQLKGKTSHHLISGISGYFMNSLNLFPSNQLQARDGEWQVREGEGGGETEEE